MKLATEPAAPGSAQAYLVNETQVADRWLVRNGALTLEVPDIPKARQEAIRILRAAGGYIENESMSGEPLRMGSMTARVPVQKYEDTMEKLKAGTRVLAESTNTDDVTTQAVDAQARLKVLRAEEQSCGPKSKVSSAFTAGPAMWTRSLSCVVSSPPSGKRLNRWMPSSRTWPV